MDKQRLDAIRALRACGEGKAACAKCPFDEPSIPHWYPQCLFRAVATAADHIARLTADLAAMTAERDVMRERAEAAERDLRAYLDRILHSAPGTYGPYACHLCKHSDIHNTSCRVKTKCDGISRWEWRGPVDGKEVPQ